MSTIVLSAGGTGGHLFPAQALAGELAKRGRRIVIMTDRRGRHYESAFPGAEIEQVPSATFVGSLLLRALAPLRIAAGILVSFLKLRRIKPSAVVGFGGYPSLPVVAAALLKGVPTAIHEQNAVLGRVNRLFADRVKAVTASLPLARSAPKDSSRIVYTGNPVRPEAAQLAATPYSPPGENETIHLLVFGGSQGARALSEAVPAAIALLPEHLRKRIAVVQQCRPEDLAGVRSAYSSTHVNAEIAAFFDDLPARMAAAHLVIARSGASTVSELAEIGRPAILIPYPFAMDDHQTANATVFANAGAAWLLQQRDVSAEMLARLLDNIFADPAELARRAAAALSLGKPDAASRLADVVDDIARSETT
jgi:UDP-N-acetylglucosamine--N-acetylmuramyl-(pentapeptide) pyrophosphoryl-undecaprenol N-acetylglucosamine transferase